METILMVAGAAGEAVGSLTAAALYCWLLWNGFRLMRHPEWSAVAVLALPVLALAGLLPRSEFLGMALVFTIIGAVPLWIAGRAWHRRAPADPGGRPEPGMSG